MTYIDNNPLVSGLAGAEIPLTAILRYEFRLLLTGTGRMARDGINNIICDNILRKFDGHKSISMAKMRDSKFYANIDAEWEVVERHIAFLIHDRTLKEEDSVLSLTNKGWFMMNNSEKVGYVAQKIDEVQWRKSESDTRIIVRVAIYVAMGAGLLWTIVQLISILT